MQKMIERYEKIVNQEAIMCTWCHYVIKKDEECIQGKFFGHQKWHLRCKPKLKGREQFRNGHGRTGQRRLARDMM